MRIARWFLFIPLFCLLILSFGCATKTISRADFQELNHSTSELRSQADAALEELEDAARKGFVKGEPLQVGDAPDDPKGIKPSELQLQWDQNPFRPTMKKTPLHLQMRQFRQVVDSYNQSLVQYTRLLVKLSDGSGDAAQLNDLAGQANANIQVAREALGMTFSGVVEEQSDRGIALFSATATEVLRQRLEEDRREYLLETMSTAQPTIQEMSEHFENLTWLLIGSVQERYLAWFDEQSQEFAGTGDRSKQRRILAGILDRNHEVLGLVDLIRTMRDAYVRLPDVHGDVRSSLEKQESAILMVRGLYEDAVRLRKQVEALQDR